MATDIDLPFLPSAAQIRRREFASVRRGYDPDQVRDYLAQVAEQVDNLEGQLREARLEEGGIAGSSGGTATLRGPVRATLEAAHRPCSPPPIRKPRGSWRRLAPTPRAC